MAQAEGKLLEWSNDMFKEYIKNGWTPNVYDREKGETKKEKAKDEALIVLQSKSEWTTVNQCASAPFVKSCSLNTALKKAKLVDF